MSVLNVTVNSKGRAGNLAEIGDLVLITFVQPPTQATEVKVEVHETPGPGDEVKTDRLIATYSGQISGGKFKLDAPGGGDPLNPNPDSNPVLGNFKRRGNFKFNLQFEDDPKENPIPMPDVEEENGRFEIQLKVTGKINGTATTAAGTAVVNLSLWRDVMIVPDVSAPTVAQRAFKDFQIFSENSGFADQWRKFAGARRSVLRIPIDATLQKFEDTVTQAAAIAAHGDIILFVGHGGEGVNDPSTGQQTQTSFDSTPSTVLGMSNHPNLISETVLDLRNKATEDPANPGKWIVKPNNGDTQAQIDALAPRFNALTRIGKVLKQQQVGRFIVMTCKMGGDSGFRHNLSAILQVPVRAYDAFVVTAGFDSFVQIWTQSDHNPNPPDLHRPTVTDAPNDSSFHEIPGGLR